MNRWNQANQAGAAAAPPDPNANAGAPPDINQPPVIRARNPAKWSHNNELNFGSKQDRDYYKQAIEKLDGEPFDGQHLALFLKKVEAKATQFNWHALLTYTYQGNPPTMKTLLQNYGEIRREKVRQKATTYLGTSDRQDQDSDMIYYCLCKSITEEVFVMVVTEPEQYTYLINQEPLVDGPCFLASIIDHTYTSTKANTTVARDNLATLAEYMESLPDGNIKQFNQYVKTQLEVLAAGGETTNDLVTNLFKGYGKVKDKAFREWLRTKKSAILSCNAQPTSTNTRNNIGTHLQGFEAEVFTFNPVSSSTPLQCIPTNIPAEGTKRSTSRPKADARITAYRIQVKPRPAHARPTMIQTHSKYM
jgi:hypothetical protein